MTYCKGDETLCCVDTDKCINTICSSSQWVNVDWPLTLPAFLWMAEQMEVMLDVIVTYGTYYVRTDSVD